MDFGAEITPQSGRLFGAPKRAASEWEADRCHQDEGTEDATYLRGVRTGQVQARVLLRFWWCQTRPISGLPGQ
jgi:hypothetical protein